MHFHSTDAGGGDDAARARAYIGPSMAESREERIRRLAYRAGRRGFKEADLVIGGFARARLSALDGRALDDFEALLGEADPDIYAWVMGQADAPAHRDTAVLAEMRDFARAGGAAAD